MMYMLSQWLSLKNIWYYMYLALTLLLTMESLKNLWLLLLSGYSLYKNSKISNAHRHIGYTNVYLLGILVFFQSIIARNPMSHLNRQAHKICISLVDNINMMPLSTEGGTLSNLIIDRLLWEITKFSFTSSY